MKRYLTLFFLLITSIALCAYPEGAINNIDGSALGWDEANQVWRPIAVDATGKLSSGSSPAVASISIDTSSIDSALNIEDKTVTELVNGIGTDTKNIENKLVATFTSSDYPYTTSNKTIAEMLKPIYEAYSQSPDNIPYILTSILNVNGGIATYLGTNVGQDVGAIKTETSAISKQPSEFRTARLSNISANTVTQINVITDLSSIATHREFVELRAIDPDTEFYIGFANTLTDSNGRPVKGRILLSMPSTQSLYIYHTNASAIDIQQTEGWR